MNLKTFFLAISICTIVSNCSNNINYSETFKNETAGNYLYNQDDLIKVYYVDDKLMLNWRDGQLEPVALDTNEFFVAEMYKKFHFVIHPETNQRYLSEISEDDKNIIRYDYAKAPAGYKTPSTLLKEGDYEKALKGYLEIQAQDSTSIFIREWDFNSMAYKHVRQKEYVKAIEILKINAALHPYSSNVYDSLGEVYLLTGDSLFAYNNYKKALEINSENRTAKSYVNAYESKN